MNSDELFMRRCLQLAANGRQNAKPNPMVGAVIVCEGRIIGEGYHVRCGQSHAEVNAFSSVKPCDLENLRRSTIYVSLEPCCHFGKTPPCADLIIQKGVKRVVVGCLDPFSKVAGKGVEKLQHAGIEVTVGVLEEECKRLNCTFFTFHEKHRPFITLKWAQSSNGFIDNNFHPYRFSNSYTQMLVHKLRREHDAILVGRITEDREHPQLNVREWVGRNPKKIVCSHTKPLPTVISELYSDGIQSLLVEGGRQTLQWFIDNNLFDEIRIEISDVNITTGTLAPRIPSTIDNSKIHRLYHPYRLQ